MAVLYRYDATLGAFVPATGGPGPKGDPGDPGTPGSPGAPGSNGWSPIYAVASDGTRRVLQVTDWTGGTGTKPATGVYLGPTGFVTAIASAVNISPTNIDPSMIAPGTFQNGTYNFTSVNVTTDLMYGNRSISRGHVASATKTTNSGPGNSTTVATTIITTPSFPVIAGRRYKVTGQAYQVTNATAGRSFIFDYFVASGGASLTWEPNRDFQTFATAATLPLGNHVGWFVSNSTVNITLSWRFISSGTAGSLTVIGNATDPIAIHVEDMGI